MITKRDNLGRIKRIHELVYLECRCGKNYETSTDRINQGRGKYCSKECMYNYRNLKQRNSHHMWKGKNVSYSGLHKWIAKKYGQKLECEWCEIKTDNPHKIHWANITGQYNRNKINWARLCAKCHWHYDRRGDKYGTENNS